MTTPGAITCSNRLLDSLDPGEFESIREYMRIVPLHLGDCLFEPGEPIGRILFPLSGAGSILSMLPDGRSVELTMVGREGMLGLPFLFGVEVANWGTLVQLPGEALSMPAATLRRVLPDYPRLQRALHEFEGLLFTLVGQTASCNRFHDLPSRFARWVLMTHDRAEGDSFPMTHEFLSTMLGVRRASISTAANQVQRSGAIGYRRGQVEVIDRAALEAAACDCYRVVQQETARLDRLLGVR